MVTTVNEPKAYYRAPLRPGHTVFGFSATVIDLRTGERMTVEVEANTKASAGKLLREYGYKVHDMCFI